jgi:signal transduction histidine kinase
MLLRKMNELYNSLLFRLTILYATAFTILSTIGFLVFYYRIYDVAMDRLDDELKDEVGIFAERLETSGLAAVCSSISDEMKTEDPAEVFYRLFDFRGETFISSDMSAWGSVAKQEILQEMQRLGLTDNIRNLEIEASGKKARMITATLGPGAVLQVGESLEDVEEYLGIFIKLFSVLMICVIAVSTFVGWLLARRATMDMNEVTRTAQEISEGDHTRRVRIRGRLWEIERLGDTFNHMLDRISSLLKSMKEINDNIAHDLRSPLARIRGIAEMSLLNTSSVEAYQEMAASTIEECDNLIEMINTMLDITEAEAGVNGTQPEPTDLVKIIKEACELFRPIAGSKQVLLSTNLPQSLIVVSDHSKLQRIVTNLLENAIKYTPENKMVTITAVRRDDQIKVDFKDMGIGISEKDLPYIFDRFYRCDQSRPNDGVGLGLSLVKAYIESLNGSIDVESVSDQGSCFTLRLSP